MANSVYGQLVELHASQGIKAADVLLVMEGIRAKDPSGAIAQFSDVQRRVYNDGKGRAEDTKEWQETITSNNLDIFRQAIQKQLSKVGCGSRLADLSERLRQQIEEKARTSAESIIATFNYDLAHKILTIGRETPRANYRTYRTRLFGDTNNSIYAGFANWAAVRGVAKAIQIGVSETAQTVNAAVEMFWQKNRDLEPSARVLPLSAACPICQAGVAGNPYRTVTLAYRASSAGWPAHVSCPHYVEADASPRQVDCSQIWAGGL